MSFWSRILNVVRGDRLNREIDEELESHIAEAVEQGRDPAEARRAFGSRLRCREASRDVRLLPWLDSLRADTVFGWRQIRKRKVTSAAAILSLALAIGACTSAFRLVDALLLRPLPVAEPGRLFVLLRLGTGLFDGKPRTSDSYEYPLFRQLRDTVKDQAELIAISYTDRRDLTYGRDQDTERSYVQYVSGRMFTSFGLRPAVGRLLTERDDLEPGAHPYAVLSRDYWTRRFGQDPKVVGRTFRMGDVLYEIVGVVDGPFTGTETGTVTDIFLPTMMNADVTHADRAWFRTLVRLKPGVAIEPVRARMGATFRASLEERAMGFSGRPRRFVERFLAQTLLLEPAGAGVSQMQKDYRVSLAALGILVALVLLIACANVANLLTAQAAARAREMALRVSIGAGRWRLVQLVLVESTLLAGLAGAIGGSFAWWAAPFVAGRINPPDNPARLSLPADWRVLAFGLALTAGAMLLFGLAPALRAWRVQPASALKGGNDPHSRQRLMHALVAVQVAFCCLVLFVGGLFAATFNRLSNQPTGFSAHRLLTLDTVVQQAQPPVFWGQVAERLRAVPGVEAVALAQWPLLSGNGSNGFISVNGAPPSESMNYFLGVSPGWAGVMKIPFLGGRDFRSTDVSRSVAIVNETFVKQYFNGGNPVGKSFEKAEEGGRRIRFEIVGWARDVRQRDMREPISASVYLPFQANGANGVPQPRNRATFIVRTTGSKPLAIAPALREEVRRARPDFRVSNIRTQQELNQSHTIRERLLAMLAAFFAGVALLLAGVGLYGVLDYSVLQRRREIGIRMAIGAEAGGIVRLVTVEVLSMVVVGALAGLGLGLASARYIESLLYGVKATDSGVLALPALTILAVALLAAAPAVVRAVRIDAVAMLRSE